MEVSWANSSVPWAIYSVRAYRSTRALPTTQLGSLSDGVKNLLNAALGSLVDAIVTNITELRDEAVRF